MEAEPGFWEKSGVQSLGAIAEGHEARTSERSWGWSLGRGGFRPGLRSLRAGPWEAKLE